MNRIAGSVADTYRILLRLYPIHFQQEYGEEMAAVFCQACRGSAEISVWSVVQLGLYEVWELPGNLMKEYAAEMEKKAMNNQPKPGEPLIKSIFRGIFSFGIGFGLIYMVYCLIDTILNAGNTIWKSHSVWNTLYLHPTAIAYGLSVAIMGFHYRKRKVWVSAVAAFIIHTLFFRIWVAGSLSFRTSIHTDAEMQLFSFIFLTITGILVGGVIGLIQYGWKKAGWFALAGVLGFNLGWIVEDAISNYLIIQSPYFSDINYMVVGNLWYFLYLVIPVILYGGIVGIVIGITTAVINQRRLIAEHL